MTRNVLVTGAAGGIGQALVSAYAQDGWRVIATDRHEPAGATDASLFIPADLEDLVHDPSALEAFIQAVTSGLNGTPLDCLVNNAALQLLGSAPNILLEDWQRTMAVNLTLPFLLAQGLIDQLRQAEGVIINIGSVHAQATKREFVSYATSKAAIHGLTRALAVDLGPSPRVLCVAPAAVNTTLLQEGFEGRPDAFSDLAVAHPAGRIASPQEIAQSVVSLSQAPFMFATGSTVWLDGGVLSRLHDPA